MKPLLIEGGRIIDPSQGIDEIGSLLIIGSKISWLGKGEELPPEPYYDLLNASGLIVCPGFIDLHCHLREPGFEEKETIATGTRAAARGGFTTACCMPNTNPPLDNKETIEYVKSKAVKEGIIRVLPIGCITKGRKGEELVPMAKLASTGVVGFSDDGEPVSNSTLMRKALEFSRDSRLPIIDHCEDKKLSAGGLMNEGRISAKLGFPGIPAAAEENMVARDLRLAKETGGWIHIAHVSTSGSVGLIRQAKKAGIRVTAEVTPHHLTLTEETVDTFGSLAKVNPPLRTQNDIKALIEGLKDGTIDIIATDHAPHTQVDRECEFAFVASGFSGLETALGSLMSIVYDPVLEIEKITVTMTYSSNMRHDSKLSLPALIAKLTSQPARIIGDKHGKLGTLTIGAPANITIFDPNKGWIVNTKDFVSKGKNTPLAGYSLKGKVMATIFQGGVVYKDDSIQFRKKDTVKLHG
ncbi:MAG: dihydroorotase [Chloroflexota bacterium]